ncbi:4-hydroxy-3-methylbut-2-enyl diphosphate reductase [Limibaculum sp. M0105]|uniref:4-hydroxy-3-methylbut-2-enyl diphosphate reductase n=1 Tax=Thermohalobaculum xanthum TaxID=2753746 RepID=A0A8J7M4W5_9RHOB|nr:4-hydroxy-3-methylbut-2-enyl diphosphate reductase [Thermohalobaculum xanthum]MBK0397732.1 4-hydroxy-3-methylbut-2-enyl diphosphate reductase [Thermohalobaculum xanthum]
MEGVEGRSPLRVVLANPRGFCAGVERAIETVERALELYGAPVYVRHEIVHNRRVCDDLRQKGAIFVEDLDDVPTGAITIFSAHGVARRVEDEAERRGLDIIDATCPLVAKVHAEGRRYAEAGYQVILIGHAGHPEVVGTLGQIPAEVHVVADVTGVDALPFEPDEQVAYVTQTTLSVVDTRGIVAAILRRWPGAQGQDTRDICYATQNRQQAVIDISGRVDLVLVVGAPNSSNSNRLVEIARAQGVAAYLVPTPEALDPAWLDGVGAVGISAGASAPEVLVQETLGRLAEFRHVVVEAASGVREDVVFRLPRELDAARPRMTVAG